MERKRLFVIVTIALSLMLPAIAFSQSGQTCDRGVPGAAIQSPAEIRSHDGVLTVTLIMRSVVTPEGQVRYCYIDDKGNESPTLRLHSGDLLVLKLKNEITVPSPANMHAHGSASICDSLEISPGMVSTATNLHFHGLTGPPVCHQDDVLHTVIPAQVAAFEYRLRIPLNQPPGLYWYHPHFHGHTEEQVLGGASGALIVEGIEDFNAAVSGLPERVIVIRDQVRNEETVPGQKPPSKDLSVNYVPVPYPDYPPAILQARPGQREFWRVLNASADTFIDLHLLANGKWQNLGLVSLDGVPVEDGSGSGSPAQTRWLPNLLIPPGGRAEFLFDAPPKGWVQILAAGVDTAPFVDEDDPSFVPPANPPVRADEDDYTPPRWIAKVMVSPDAPALPSILPHPGKPAPPWTRPDLRKLHPAKTRRLYFSEKVMDSKNPRTSTEFYLTEQGHKAAVFDPASGPDIIARQGTVEDWILENRSREAHTFHIHQTHFLVLERDGVVVKENDLRDTIDLPYWDGTAKRFPRVKVRIDLRDPATVGTFPYHCHILQHEDGGMMGTIRVLAGGAVR